MTDRRNRQFVFGRILILANKMQLLGDQVIGEVTLKQWLLLSAIQRMENKAPSFAEIGKEIGTSRQNVSKMITALEKKGLVSLQHADTDRRASFVSLTPKCFEYVSAKEDAGNILLDTLFSDIPMEETEAAANFLYQMLQNAQAALGKEI